MPKSMNNAMERFSSFGEFRQSRYSCLYYNILYFAPNVNSQLEIFLKLDNINGFMRFLEPHI